MTYHAIFTVLKALGVDPILASDLAYEKYGNDPFLGFTGKKKWDAILKNDLQFCLGNRK